MSKEVTSEWAESQIASEGKSQLDEIVGLGARKMLAAALEAEVDDYIRRNASIVNGNGHRMVVRNGYAKSRELLSGAGKLNLRQPRVDDRRPGYSFASAILPPYMRRSPSLDKLIPCLYLKGISTGQFSEALETILGPDAAGLSAKTVGRLLD
jgi:transposase-like protein